MAELKTKATQASALDFIAGLPDEQRRKDCLAIMEMMKAATGAEPVPVIHFHGDADKLNPYQGEPRPGGLKFAPVEETIGRWVGHNGCTQQTAETQTENIVHRVYSPCSDSAQVEIYKILGGEHAWLGGEAVNAIVGQPTTEIAATPLMWAFFAAHPLP
jgi:polyhydroxybutyrate depolymerase